jgi:hypothetical protein
MNQKPIKINHHYVPASHLANFTKKGVVDSRLWVFDTETGKQWEDKPKNVAFKKRLYNVDVPDQRPDVLEDVFADIENKAAPIIREICESLIMPTGDDYNWLMNYIALLAERTPARREVHEKPMHDISKIMLQMMLSTPERYEAVRRSMAQSGEPVEDNVSYEQLRRFAYEEKYTLSFDNNTHIKNLMAAVDAILQPLASRHWSVVLSPSPLGDFICSDNPVSLHWATLKDRGFWSSPGHGLLDTEVSVPLSSRVALLGRFEKVHPPSAILASRKTLASINSNTGRHSQRFIFSRKNDFFWYTKDNRIGNVDEYKRFIQMENQKA